MQGVSLRYTDVYYLENLPIASPDCCAASTNAIRWVARLLCLVDICTRILPWWRLRLTSSKWFLRWLLLSSKRLA